MKVKLNWEFEGYRPELYSWKNYNISTNSYAIRHDIYHHQPNERGYAWEEIRAFGARLHFEKKHQLEAFRNFFNSAYSPLIETEPFDFPFTGNELENQPLIKRFIKNYWNMGDSAKWYEIMLNGFNYAKEFSNKDYVRFGYTRFDLYHREGKDLVVDKSLGEVVEETLSKEYENSIH